MSFPGRFLSYDATIEDSDRETSQRVFLKTPLHPDGTQLELFLRVIAHLLSWEPEIVFSHGRFEPELPSSYIKDVTGAFTLAVWVNPSHSSEIDFFIRHHRGLRPSLYFTTQSTLTLFCQSFKPPHPPWIKTVVAQFFDENDALTALIDLEASRTRVELTVVDGTGYLTANTHESQFHLTHLDLLSEYQKVMAELDTTASQK